MGSPVKLHPGSQLDSRRHYVLETEAGLSNGLRAMVTLRDYQKKRLSRSMDGLMKVCVRVCVCTLGASLKFKPGCKYNILLCKYYG